MRVIAGTLGGRRLVAPRDRATRPTADRIKEALFSILGEIDDASVLDLYAGTGALGIEAISRGAKRACFVESANDAARAIRSNIESLAIGAQCELIVAQVERASARLRGPFDVVFADPPYADAQAALVVVASIARAHAEAACIVFERASKSDLDYAAFEIEDTRTYGDTAVDFLRLRAT